jgi:hypothetical protein
MHISNLKVSFMIYNLYTWTKYTGIDPEVPIISTDPFFIGVDNSDTPPPRDFILSLDVRF